MLNRVTLLGRLAQDINLKTLPDDKETKAANFILAVDRYTKPGTEKKADFINCCAYGPRAEFIAKHFRKGGMIAIDGKLSSRSYTDENGVKHYVTEVRINDVSFAGDPKGKHSADSAESEATEETVFD